jgi:hypothetical protein
MSRTLESFAPPEKPPQLWDLRQVRRVAPIFLAILAIRRRLCSEPTLLRWILVEKPPRERPRPLLLYEGWQM